MPLADWAQCAHCGLKHTVRADGTVEGGNVPRKWLREQMKYFNHSFRGHGHGAEGARTPFKFTLAGVDRTTNADWFHKSYPPEYGADSSSVFGP